jgi:hypothetical protein
MNNPRRNVRNMPYRRRQDGINAGDRSKIEEILGTVGTTLAQAARLPMGAIQFGMVVFAASLLAIVRSMYSYNWYAVASVRNPNLANRGFASFTEEEAYRDLRFHLNQLPDVMQYLRIPAVVHLPFQSPYCGTLIIIVCLI